MIRNRTWVILMSLVSSMSFSAEFERQIPELPTLKVMTLNLWGGQIKEPLLKFIKTQQDMDVICVQEAYKDAPEKICTNDDPVSLNIFNELHEALPQHAAYFRPVVNNIYGIGMFVKKSVQVVGEGESKIYENPSYPGRGPTHTRILQWLTCKVQDVTCTVVNVHGLWNGNGKTDTPERLLQSKNIVTFLQTLSTPKILCGDFNLRPDTDSIKLLESHMINLIQHFNITCTRTPLYTKPEKFADYVFISGDIKPTTFKVLPDEVSDHSPIVGHFVIGAKPGS